MFTDYHAPLSLETFANGGRRSADVAVAHNWLKTVHLKRFVVSSENEVKGVINSERVKRFVSGGDPYFVRLPHAPEPFKLSNRSTWFVFVNDLPKVSTMDDAMCERVGAVVELLISFKENPVGPFEKPVDHSLKDLFHQQRFQDAFTCILTDAYLRAVSNGKYSNPAPACVVKSTKKWTDAGLKSILGERFEITRESEDFVLFRDIKAWVSYKGLKISDVKLGMELRALTSHESVLKSVNGEKAKIRQGIKVHSHSRARLWKC